MMLILWPWYSNAASASEAEIPRCVSSGSKSVVVVPSSTRPRRLIAPELYRSASASVVLPDPPCPTRATLRIFAGGKLFMGRLAFRPRQDRVGWPDPVGHAQVRLPPSRGK